MSVLLAHSTIPAGWHYSSCLLLPRILLLRCWPCVGRVFQVSTWWPVAPSARNSSATYKGLPILDNYANKHWNGLIRDFYAKRVQCYVNQVIVDLPASKPSPSPCKLASVINGTYLPGYPMSLGSGGVLPPSTWPYDTSSLAAASAWCCQHGDCGGVTHQNGRYEVRAGGCTIPNPSGSTSAASYPRSGGCAELDMANVTRCVVTAEMDFTQDTTVKYLEEATTAKMLALSTALIAKYQQYV